MNTKTNKLIAEFLGYTQPHPDYPTTTYWYKEGRDPLTMLSFDTDWNWLMEVVDEIEGFEDEDRCARFNVIIEQSFIEIIDCHTSEEIATCHFENKKFGTYLACIEFIKWYNKYNSK